MLDRYNTTYYLRTYLLFEQHHSFIIKCSYVPNMVNRCSQLCPESHSVLCCRKNQPFGREKSGHLTVVTVDGGVQFETKVCSVYLPTSLRGVLKCKKGSLSVVYSGQERTYEFKCKLATILWTLRTQPTAMYNVLCPMHTCTAAPQPTWGWSLPMPLASWSPFPLGLP